MKTLTNPDHRREVMHRIAQVRPDSTRRWGRMTAPQMLCHLTDSFDVTLGMRPIPDASNVFSRTVMKFFALRLPVPWPKGVKTMPEVDQEIAGTPPGDFMDDLKKLQDTAEAFVETLDPAKMRHPLFGTMTRAEWGRWAYLHIDHHARQFGL